MRLYLQTKMELNYFYGGFIRPFLFSIAVKWFSQAARRDGRTFKTLIWLDAGHVWDICNHILNMTVKIGSFKTCSLKEEKRPLEDGEG